MVKRSVYLLALILIVFTGFVIAMRNRTMTGPERTNSAGHERKSLSQLMASMYIDEMAPGQKAPDFQLRSLGGEQVRLSEYRGKVVFLSFWTTW